MKIAILSDTHGLLRPEVVEQLKNADAILHGGDINKQSIVDELRQYAPLYVVRGNNDKEWAEEIPHDLTVTLKASRFTWFTIRRKSQQIFPVWTWWYSDTPTSMWRRKKTGYGGSIPAPAAHGGSIRKLP